MAFNEKYVATFTRTLHMSRALNACGTKIRDHPERCGDNSGESVGAGGEVVGTQGRQQPCFTREFSLTRLQQEMV